MGEWAKEQAGIFDSPTHRFTVLNNPASCVEKKGFFDPSQCLFSEPVLSVHGDVKLELNGGLQ
jgi:hypothetical protein